MSSNLEKILELRRLTKKIDFDDNYLYGKNGRVPAFFEDQNWTINDRNALFQRYVRELEENIARRNRLRRDLRISKSDISRRKVKMLDQKVPKNVLQEIENLVTAPQNTYRTTAATLRLTRATAPTYRPRPSAAVARGRTRRTRRTRKR